MDGGANREIERQWAMLYLILTICNKTRKVNMVSPSFYTGNSNSGFIKSSGFVIDSGLV